MSDMIDPEAGKAEDEDGLEGLAELLAASQPGEGPPPWQESFGGAALARRWVVVLFNGRDGSGMQASLGRAKGMAELPDGLGTTRTFVLLIDEEKLTGIALDQILDVRPAFPFEIPEDGIAPEAHLVEGNTFEIPMDPPAKRT